MVFRKKRKDSGPARLPRDSSTSRTRNLLQRLSSNFSSMVPNFRLRRNSRARTAPDLNVRDGLGLGSRQLESIGQIPLARRVIIPMLSRSGTPTPYDDRIHHSSSPVENSPYMHCNWRGYSRGRSGPSRFTAICDYCQSKADFSHQKSRTQNNPDTQDDTSAGPSNQAHRNSMLLSPDHARSLPSATRSENTRSKFRGGSASASSSQRPLHFFYHIRVTHEPEPESPKLHHLPLLSKSKEYQYVHRHEVESHLAALRSGAPSPLRRSIPEASQPTHRYQETTIDFSETVFYDRIASAPSSARSSLQASQPRPHIPATRRVHDLTETNVEVATGQPSGSAISSRLERRIQRSRPYRQQRLQQSEQHGARQQPTGPQRKDDEGGSSRMHGDGKRPELRGDNASPANAPHLRGGRGDKGCLSRLGNRYAFKDWIRARIRRHSESSSYDSDSDSEGEVPPARSASKAQRYGRIAVPRNIPDDTHTSPPEAALDNNSIRSASSNHPGFHNPPSSPPASQHPDPPTKQPDLQHEYSATYSTCQPPNIPASMLQPSTPAQPQLSSSSSSETSQASPTIYWLARERETPLASESREKQEGKKKMGELWGMTIYGAKPGEEWEVTIKGEEGADLRIGVGVVDETGQVVDEGPSSSARTSGNREWRSMGQSSEGMNDGSAQSAARAAYLVESSHSQLVNAVQDSTEPAVLGRKGSVEYIEGIGLVRDV